MEVILVKDVEKLGQYGDIKNVKSGFARNFLIPKGLAVVATPDAKEKATKEKEKYLKEKEERIAKNEKLKNELEKIKLEFKVKTTDNRMFGSITNQDIINELSKKISIKIDKRDIEIDKIHKLGEYEAKVKLGEGILANIKIRVSGEEIVTKKKK